MSKWLAGFLITILINHAWAQAPSAVEDSPAVATPDIQIERQPLRSRHQLQLQRLQLAYPQQLRKLSSQYDEAAALHLPAHSKDAKGWIILLPEKGKQQIAHSILMHCAKPCQRPGGTP